MEEADTTEESATNEAPGELTQAEKDALFAEGQKEAMVTLGVEAPSDEPNEKPPIESDEDAGDAPDVKDKDADAGDIPDAGSSVPVIAGLNDEELKTTLAKISQIDSMFEAMKGQFGTETQKIFGMLGEFKSKLKDLSEQKGPTLSAVKLAKLRTEYPDMADLLEADLGTLPAASTFNPAELEERVGSARNEATAGANEKIAKLSWELESMKLELRHKDWQKTVASSDFGLWRGTLSAEKQELLRKSGEASYMAEALDDFREWEQRKQTNKQTKNERLENAIPPNVTQRPPGKTKTLADLFKEGQEEAAKELRGR